MKITPVSKTLADVFRGNFIKIPRFQRAYDWDRDNLTEFWNDIKSRSDPDYFMGSIVVFTDRKEKNLLSLVDGQQRVTTITIMLAVIRNVFVDYEEEGLAAGIHDLIETKDLDSKSRYVLEHDSHDSFFQFRVQNRNPDTKVVAEGVQQENLQVAFRFLDSALKNHLKESFSSQPAKAVTYLKHFRDCLLQMHFISVELDNEDDAYLIFETLNTRGKDLRASDLLKNHFMRLIPSRVKGADEAKTTWVDIMNKLGSVTVSIDPDSFLLHYWLSTKSYVSKASLFSHFKEGVKKANVKHELENLRLAAGTYIRCLAPTETSWHKEERSLKDSLQALRVFGVAQAAPLILAIMRKYEAKVISLRSAKQAIEVIEKFAFQFNAITQSRGGGGVSNMYAKLAQSATSCSTPQQFTSILTEIKDKLRERVPDQTEFTLAFARLTYRNSYTRDRALVRYAMTKLAEYFGMPDELDRGALTIEHLVPQSEGEETDDEFDVGAIGNLILVNEDLNARLGVKSFVEKVKILKEANNLYFDKEILEVKAWDMKKIAIRGINLAEIGYSKIWRI